MAPLPTVTESPRVMLIQLSGDGSGAPRVGSLAAAACHGLRLPL